MAFLRRNRRAILISFLLIGLALTWVVLRPQTRIELLRGLLAQRTLVILLLGFGLILISLLWSAGQVLDAWIFLSFNLRGYHKPWMDRVMWGATQLGNVVTAIVMAGIFFAKNNRLLAIEILLGIFTLWLLVEFIKALTDRARPFITLAEVRVIGWHERGLSFPSGHTAQTFFLMSLLAHRFDVGTAGSLALYGVGLLVGYTRIYVGAHYPRDVLAGAILGGVWGILVVLLDAYLTARPLF